MIGGRGGGGGGGGGASSGGTRWVTHERVSRERKAEMKRDQAGV